MTKALTDLGIMDHVSWNAGASGGAWYVLAHTLASLDSTTGMKDVGLVFDNVKVNCELICKTENARWMTIYLTHYLTPDFLESTL